MRLRNEWYIADKGKHFVLTEKGKAESATFRHMTVGEPTSEYNTEATRRSIEAGHEIEVDIPNWIIKEGYEVVYNHKGYTLTVGNPIVFPERILAEKYMNHHKSNVYRDYDLYIRETVYEGRALKPCIEYDGRQVYNKDWCFGIDALQIGDLVEQEIIDDLMGCLPPVCMRSDCSQLGEPANHKKDVKGNFKATYATFKKISEGIWEYCGDCFRGENVAV